MNFNKIHLIYAASYYMAAIDGTHDSWRTEIKWIETLKQKEEEIIRKDNEEQLKQPCKCGIMIINICMCEIPKYELMKLSNNLFCINCNNWKCRCK
jgi:hypothetical protein